MTLTCKAAVLRSLSLPQPYAESRPLGIEEVTLDDPGPMEILVKVIGAGLCHSDLSVINGSRGRDVPMVMGHEGSGIVVEVGSAVTDIRPDDHVAFQFSVSCGRCRACQSGRPNICEIAPVARAKGELISGGTRIRDAQGQLLRHQAGVSCFAEYAVVDRGSVVAIPKDLSLIQAAVFGCAVMTGVGSVVNTARVSPGDSVAIFGLGGVGLSGVMGAKVAGADTIVAVDLDPAKLDRAKALGATHCFDARDNDLVGKVKDLTGGGVDYAIDLAGAIPALEAAYAVTVRGGKVVTAGLAPFGATFAFEQGDLVSNEKSILGSYMGSCVPVRDIPRFIRLQESGVLPVESLIDDVIGFDDINAGFDRLAAGTTVRQILAPHGPDA
jgi:Zn-dependent alcohol dehydrogenase